MEIFWLTFSLSSLFYRFLTIFLEGTIHSQDIENKCKSNVYMIIHGFLPRTHNNVTHLTYSITKNISAMISTKGFTSKLRYMCIYMYIYIEHL